MGETNKLKSIASGGRGLYLVVENKTKRIAFLLRGEPPRIPCILIHCEQEPTFKTPRVSS